MPRINANGVEIYYESVGEGTPLILHGHHHQWYMPLQVPYFSQFYRVIVFDRRGTGRSSEPAGPWTAADLAADIKGLMDGLEIEKAIVGGISLGGVVSSQFGADYPERALALVVGHTVPYLWPLGAEWLQQQIASALGQGPIIVRQPRSYEWESDGPPTIGEGFEHTQLGKYLATIENPFAGSSITAITSTLNVLAVWDQRPRFPELAQLDVPVLVIVGGNEPQKTIELSHEWSQQYKNADFVILPNAHHNAGTEYPVEWNVAVHDFLKRNGL